MDSADELYSYLTAVSQGAGNVATVRAFCEHSAGTIEWLQRLGASFRSELHLSGLDWVPRGHIVSGGGPAGAFGQGAALVEVLLAGCRDRGIRIDTGTRVVKLRPGAAGSPIEVHGEADVTYRARAVIIATGGFAGDRELVHQYLPSVLTAGAGACRTLSAPGSVGDGLRLGLSVGAAIDGMGRGTIHLAPEIVVDAYIYVNERGVRFVDERMYSSFRSAAAAAQKRCYVVFDEAARLRVVDPFASVTDEPSALPVLWGVRQPAGHTKAATGEPEPTESFRADTVGGLADALGVPAAALQATIDAYNAHCASSVDSEFLRRVNPSDALTQPPFHAVRLRRSTIVQTGCGLVVDSAAQILDRNRLPLSGLFAAGEVTHSPYPVYPASGMSLATGFTFGRIAGRNAAHHAARGRCSD
jgi:fumarate reductase flavoprotein subunit